MFTVSAIVTMYNCAPFVEDALISVLGQTRPVDEVLVVDDGSQDEGRQLVERFQSYGVRLVSQENRGPAAARNFGASLARGNVLAFLDCDDLWLAEKTARQLCLLEERPDIGLVGGDCWWWTPAEDRWEIKRRGGVPPARVREEILLHNFVGNPSSTLIPRRVFEALGGFDESLRFGEDWDFWARLAQRYAMAFVPQPVMIYRWHGQNISHSAQGERLDDLCALALRNIQRFAPQRKRFWLRERVRGRDALARAHHLRAERDSLTSQWRYAVQAFLHAPWDLAGQKVRLLGLLLLRARRVGKKRPSAPRPPLRDLLRAPQGMRYSFLEDDGNVHRPVD